MKRLTMVLLFLMPQIANAFANPSVQVVIAAAGPDSSTPAIVVTETNTGDIPVFFWKYLSVFNEFPSLTCDAFTVVASGGAAIPRGAAEGSDAITSVNFGGIYAGNYVAIKPGESISKTVVLGWPDYRLDAGTYTVTYEQRFTADPADPNRDTGYYTADTLPPIPPPTKSNALTIHVPDSTWRASPEAPAARNMR